MPPPTDPLWLQAQYDNRARVPDAAARIAGWTTASIAARQVLPRAQLGLPYAPGDGGTLDVYPPSIPVPGGAPVLLFIHGGYWRALSKDDFAFVAPPFCAAGAAVVVPDYALCPAVSIEHIALQMVQAVAWTVRHAPRFGADPRRLVVAGHSAGGHLAAMLLACRWHEVGADLGAQAVPASLSISGLFDLEPLRHVPFLQADLALTPASVRRLSPAFFPRPRQGRLHAVVGGRESEEFRRQNQLIRDAWGPSTVPHCEVLPGLDHFSVMDALAERAHPLHRLALQLLRLA